MRESFFRSFVHTKTVYTEEDLNALPKQVENERVILPVDVAIDVDAIQRQKI